MRGNTTFSFSFFRIKNKSYLFLSCITTAFSMLLGSIFITLILLPSSIYILEMKDK